MRKQTKLAVVLAAAALLVIGASMTSFAAQGWTADGDDWYFIDNNGDAVIDTWKAYNGNYYYLGEDGVMVKDALVDDGDYTYYVDANGAMVKNKWVAIPADEDEELDVEYRWYYFGSTGKAFKDAWKKTIDGKKYSFDGDGKMLFGFVSYQDKVNYEIINNDDDPLLNCNFYFGSNDNGAMQTGWVNYVDGFEAEAYDGDSYWFYFNTSTGEKVYAKDDKDDFVGDAEGFPTSKSIDGRKYFFDAYGAMLTGWNEVATGAAYETAYGATASDFRYLSLTDEGWMQKNTWVWAVPTEEMNADDNAEDTCRWFRVDNNGKLVVDQTKKIDGKWYVFDKFGIMRTGLVALVDRSEASNTRVNNAKLATNNDFDLTDAWDVDGLTGNQILDAEEDQAFYFFSTDEEADGSMKTGTVQVDLDDDTYTMAFNGTTGKAITGVSGNKLYRNGILRSAGDDKYGVFEGEDDVYYLVGSTGNVIKAGKYYKDADDNYYATYYKKADANPEAVTGADYVIIKVDGAYDDAAKVAKEFAKYGFAQYDTDATASIIDDYLTTYSKIGFTNEKDIWNEATN